MEPAFRGVIGRTIRDSTPSWPEAVRAPAGAPNIVVILLDDVGFADLGPFGSEIPTPHIDRLAAGGLRYVDFHVTSMCSPTRACLLTGRNAHAVGMGIIAEWSTGFPGYRGRISRRAATLAEILRDHAYNTLAVGKWHLTPLPEATAAGPYDAWPTGRGFERWYGFHGAMTDQWHPELFADQSAVDPPPRPDYHLSEDLADRAIACVRDQQSVAPEKPFFLYLAFGACHWAHQVPASYIARHRGRYDVGWDRIRAARLARQKTLGIVPPDTALAPRNPGVEAWDRLSADERRVCARLQEIYAAFLEHTDAQIGRVLDFLRSIGRLDDTLVMLLSDNGASPEGGPLGSVNARRHLGYEPDTLADLLDALDRLGSEHALNHYPTGWAQASNTPLKWYKKDTHGGGIRSPLVVHWPARIRDGGSLRRQYHHVIDIVPTVLEILGIEAPTVYQGVAQLPVHGVSLAYTFDVPGAPTRKVTQHYELLGDRALWHRGWKAVARHDKGADFEQDRWELYHTDADFSECEDLAARTRTTYVYYPGMARVDRLSAPNVTDRSWSIAAEVEIPPAGAEGVLLAVGNRFAGYVLYVKDGRLVHEYVYREGVGHRVVSDRPVPAGRTTLGFAFEKTGPRRGRGTLLIDGRPAGTMEIPKTWPLHATSSGVHCGRDGSVPVSETYRSPFPFTGAIARIVVELGSDAIPDPVGEARSALAEE
jgi:arylsulfatase A-like enzyme